MFDIGWPELVVILVVAIVVIGPRDLPRAFHTVGKWVRAARRVTSDFQRHVDDMVRETELEDLKKVANQARGFNVKNQIEKAIDPTGDLTSDINSALDIGDLTGGKGVPPASTGKPGSGAPENAIATPGVPTTPAPTAGQTVPAEPTAEKPTARKLSPRVASRVPKRTTKASAAATPSASVGAPKAAGKAAPKKRPKTAAKAPVPEQNS